MNFVKNSFFDYLNNLNENQVIDLMNYLTQLTNDFNKDYAKFKEIIQTEINNLKINDITIDSSCYSFTTCVNDSKLSLDEVELTQVTRIERNDQFVMTLNDLSKVDDITTDEDKSISILTSTGINNHETNFTYFNDEYTNYEESLISFNSTSLVEINDEFMKNYEEVKVLFSKIKSQYESLTRDKKDINYYIYKEKNLISDFNETNVIKWSLNIVDHLFTKEEMSKNNLMPTKRSKRGHLSPNRVNLFKNAMVYKFKFDSLESEKNWLIINKKINNKGRALAKKLNYKSNMKK